MRSWKTINNVEVKDLHEAILEIPETFDSREIHVGTDAQHHGLKTEYVTVVVVLNKGKGGRVFYTREKVPKIRSLREKLAKEVWNSLEVAFDLINDVVKPENLFVHVDANPDKRWASSKYVQELAGMVVGQGFKLLLKPDAWASSHAADHVVRKKNVPEKLSSRKKKKYEP